MKSALSRILTLVGILTLFLTGCMTTYKAQSFLERKGKLAAVCAASYPVKDSVVILSGPWNTDTVLHTDSIFVRNASLDGFSTENQPFSGNVYEPSPRIVTRIITRTRVDTVLEIRTDHAQESALQAQISSQTAQIGKVTTQRDSAQNGRNIWRWIALALMLPWIWKGGAGVYTLISQAEKKIP